MNTTTTVSPRTVVEFRHFSAANRVHTATRAKGPDNFIPHLLSCYRVTAALVKVFNVTLIEGSGSVFPLSHRSKNAVSRILR